MYRRKERNMGYLFPELFPFGGKLNSNNRWMKIAGMIPWEGLEEEYEKHFSKGMGRPALSARLVLGALLLRHMKAVGDEEIVKEIEESPYLQAFCGFENFQTGRIFDGSSLSRVRKRVGAEFFEELERKTYRLLVERKIIKGRGMIVDATVYPEAIQYPTDTGLLNRAREWLVKKVEEVGKKVGKRVRTYKRKARKEYLSFTKKRRKTKKAVHKMKKALLQYVRRNIEQFELLVTEAKEKGQEIGEKIEKRFEVIKRVYEQQKKMYREELGRIEERIVSLHKPGVRPIVRGKAGKKVEFGPKVALSHVDGYTFLDHLSNENFNESGLVRQQVERYEELFGKKPEWCAGDRIYGKRDNRAYLKEEGIRDAFVPLGRRAAEQEKRDRWRKRIQRKRNEIEGGIGRSKEHVMVHRIRYRIDDGAEIWVRLGLFGMNLATAIKRV